MKKTAIVVSLMVGVLLAVFVGITSRYRRAHSIAQVRMLKKGMTKKEVIEILGPPGKYSSHNVEEHIDDIISLFLIRSSAESHRREEWAVNDGLIIVAFAADRVASANSCGVRQRPWSEKLPIILPRPLQILRVVE